MRQIWTDLLFAHWPLPPEVLRPHVPLQLPLDCYNGSAWIAITPFRLSYLRVRGLPVIPRVSNFPEINVRTYVNVQGKPGVFFFSLDCASTPAVWGARAFYHLPYFRAKMTIQSRANLIEYVSRRTQSDGKPGAFRARYRPLRQAVYSKPGSLVHWLTERYCLFSVDHRGRLYRADIHHSPWMLAEAEAEFSTNTMTDAAGIHLPQQQPLLHFSHTQSVLVWPARRLELTP